MGVITAVELAVELISRGLVAYDKVAGILKGLVVAKGKPDDDPDVELLIASMLADIRAGVAAIQAKADAEISGGAV